MLLVGFALLSTACVHYPQQYSYYPDYGGYSSGYTIMHRNYYGERPDHYDHGHDRAYFPHHYRHDQHSIQPRRGNNYPRHRHQHDRGYDHPFNYENRRQHNDNDDSHHNNFDRRNHH